MFLKKIISTILILTTLFITFPSENVIANEIDQDTEILSTTNSSISATDYWYAIENGVKGQIWITKDGTHYGINHGHAAILYCYSLYYISFVEHRGAGQSTSAGLGLSGFTEWDNFDLDNISDPPWYNVTSLRTYNVSTPVSEAEGLPYDVGTMISAADYAACYLIGKEYAVLPLKGSSNYVNCATLVYQAYANANVFQGCSIQLGNSLSPTVIPKDLVEDTSLVLCCSANWDGDSHTWDS